MPEYSCPYCNLFSSLDPSLIDDGNEIEVQCACGETFMVAVSVAVSCRSQCMSGQHEFIEDSEVGRHCQRCLAAG